MRTSIRSSFSVLRRPFDVINDEHLDGAFAGLEFQPQLILQDSAQNRWHIVTRFSITAEHDIHIDFSGKARLVDHAASKNTRERSHNGVRADILRRPPHVWT